MGNKKSKYAVVDGKTKYKRSQKTNHPLQVLQVSSWHESGLLPIFLKSGLSNFSCLSFNFEISF